MSEPVGAEVPLALGQGIREAELVLPCADLAETLAFFTGLGFQVCGVFPADEPIETVISGYGVRLRLRRGPDPAESILRLSCDNPEAVARVAGGLVAPNGTRLELARADPPLLLPALAPSFVVCRAKDSSWVQGRAGMNYRDLIPGRQGGRFIASHIRIPDGGLVPDYVHYHAIRFQLIYCYRGWVRVVYQDQGPPFVLEAGDCVLQPPRIRHRVLESSPGLEVIEIGSPASHETYADQELTLPTEVLRPDRRFELQSFTWHQLASAVWRPWAVPGFEARDLGIAAATAGVAAVEVVRLAGACDDAQPHRLRHRGEMVFLFVLEAGVTLHCEGQPPHQLAVGDSAVIPPGVDYGFIAAQATLELLVVSVPSMASGCGASAES